MMRSMNTKLDENVVMSYITPAVLTMAGFPVNTIGINPVPSMASSGEYAVGLPQNIAHSLQTSFPNVFFGPGYTVSMYSCKDGLKADGIKDVSTPLPFNSERVYFMKDGQQLTAKPFVSYGWTPGSNRTFVPIASTTSYKLIAAIISFTSKAAFIIAFEIVIIVKTAGWERAVAFIAAGGALQSINWTYG